MDLGSSPSHSLSPKQGSIEMNLKPGIKQDDGGEAPGHRSDAARRLAQGQATPWEDPLPPLGDIGTGTPLWRSRGTQGVGLAVARDCYRLGVTWSEVVSTRAGKAAGGRSTPGPAGPAPPHTAL
ncbi:hypothetical protein P7K49_032913 [Saguinus oedipus]|uniref:Uncharacterized protein n=1 Tax=Saguinus oedipus TaxID=9490 RepID=A0ABQ9TQU0_SAGOE|nr:hypothetical protein P7K49_032913 [Saguinus oedipus]